MNDLPFRCIFALHVVGALASAAYVTWAHVEHIGDAYGTVLSFYMVGTLLLIVSAIVQATGKLATLRSGDS